MFANNGVNLTLEDCYELFKFVDEDGSGALSVDEFKLFLKSEGANESKSRFGELIYFSVPLTYQEVTWHRRCEDPR